MTSSSPDLTQQHCAPCTDALSDAALAQLLPQVPDWRLENGKLCRNFSFRNYYQTIAFVNALAYIVHAQDHHPELSVGYNQCVVRFDTHSVNAGKGGLSRNDFICAALISALHPAPAVTA